MGPLTEAQHQIWALDRRDPPPATLNLSYALAIDGELDRVALSGAFQDVIRAHEPLRTRYPERLGTPVAEPGDPEAAFGGLDLDPGGAGGAGAVVAPDEAAELARQERNRGFDLSRDTPLRARLLRLPAGRHLLLLTLHHIVADGWSLQVVSRQLSRAYAARRRGEVAELSRPPVECVDLARRQRRWLGSPESEKELDWWAERLADSVPRPPLPSPLVPGDGRGSVVTRYAVAIPEELTTELRRLGREARSSLYVLLLTAFQIVLRLYWDSDNVLIGSLAANRTSADAGEVLGAHYNALLVNADLGADPTFAECLLATSDRTVAALDHQRTPYRLLADRLAGDQGWSADALPGVMFLMDEYPMARLRLDGCDVTGLYLESGDPVPGAIPADLTFFVREVDRALSLSVLTTPGLFDEAASRALAQGYLEILTAMCQTPELPISELADCFEPVGGSIRGGPVPERAALCPIATIAPVEALSPVGRWYQGGAL